MEKKNGLSGILVVLVFAVVCFLVYYIVVNKKNDDGLVDSDKIIINDSLKNDVKSTIDKYLVNIFMEHSANYCGEVDYDDSYKFDSDVVSLVSYYRTKSYNSIDQVKEKFSSIISERFFNDNLADEFIESDGKVYCGLIPRGSLNNFINSVILTSVEEDDGTLSIKGYYKTNETDMNPSDTFNFEVSMVKENNLWVIDLYNEI